jgi:hypothetical protein
MQSAYRKQHSCETALTFVQSSILRAMDCGMVTPLVMLDMSAAFDTVNHQLLLNKLESIGLNGQALEWCQTYLHDRLQSVIINNVSSAPCQLITGVPQGSVLGPVLFSIYISDLTTILSKYNIGHVSYADDLQLFTPTPPLEIATTLNKIENCISEIKIWLNFNSLVLNDSKTEFIIFGTRAQLLKVPMIQLRVGDISIQRSEVVRNLGVLFDSHLTFGPHISKTCQVAYGYLRLISKVRRSMNKHTLKLIINALVMSRIDFCVSLMMDISKKHVNKVNRVIRTCSKIVSQLDGSTVDSSFLGLEKRSFLRQMLIVHTTLASSRPRYIFQLLNPANLVSLRSHTGKKLCTVFSRSEVGKRAFVSTAPRLWNTLPDDIRAIVPHSLFRGKVINYVNKIQ